MAVNNIGALSASMGDKKIKNKSAQPVAVQTPSASSSVQTIKPAKPTVSMPDITATDDKWYSGDMPTSLEVLNRIATVGETDVASADNAMRIFRNQQANPTSPYYDPYRNPTSNAAKQASAYGVNVTGWGADDYNNYLAQANAADLLHYSDTSDGITSPGSKASAAEQQAYWVYQAQKDFAGTTVKAQGEWDALQKELTFLAQSGCNYSDDEIMGKINWKNYPTLAKMDEQRQMGLQMGGLTTSIGYSADAMTGVLYAARSGNSLGNPLYDAVASVRNGGTGYVADENIADRLNPASENYAPYSVHGTVEESLGQHFGVHSFDAGWVDKNISLRDDDSYGKVGNAENTTLAAEKEIATLWESVDTYISSGLYDADQIMEDVWGEAKTLAKLQAGLDTGKLVDTTRAIDFTSYSDIKRQIEEKCNQAKGMHELENAVDLSVFGMQNNGGTDAQRSATAETTAEAVRTLVAAGYAPEKASAIVGSSAVIDPVAVSNAIVNGTITDEQANALAVSYGNQLAADKYSSSKANIVAYEQLTGQRDLLKAGYDAIVTAVTTGMQSAGMGAMDMSVAMKGTEDMIGILERQLVQDQMATGIVDEGIQDRINELTGMKRDILNAVNALYGQDNQVATLGEAYDRMEYLRQNMEEFDKRVNDAQAGYDEANETMKAIRAACADAPETLAVFDAINDSVDAYHGNTRYAYTIPDMILRSGASPDTVAAWVQNEYLTTIAGEQEAMSQAMAYCAANGINLSDDDKAKVDAYKAYLDREKRSGEYFMLRNKEDFAANVEAGRAMAVIMAMANPIYENDANLNEDELAMRESGELFAGWAGMGYGLATEDELNTYFYLLATQGQNEAKNYARFLNDDTYGVFTTRLAQRDQAEAEELARELPITASILSVGTNLGKALGFAYTEIKRWNGEEINPDSRWFTFNNTTNALRSGVSQKINDSLGKYGGIGCFLYDAFMSSVDSMVNSKIMSGITSGFVASKLVKASGAAGVFAENAISAFPMAASAYGDAVRNNLNNGMDQEHALVSAIGDFLGEWVSEIVTVDNIREFKAMGKGEKEAVSGLLSSMFSGGLEEGMGEAFGDLINNQFNDLVEMMTGWDDVGLYNEAEELWMANQGSMTWDEAKAAVVTAHARDMAMSFAAGFVSSAFSSGFSYYAGKIGDNTAREMQIANDAALMESIGSIASDSPIDVPVSFLDRLDALGIDRSSFAFHPMTDEGFLARYKTKNLEELEFTSTKQLEAQDNTEADGNTKQKPVQEEASVEASGEETESEETPATHSTANRLTPAQVKAMRAMIDIAEGKTTATEQATRQPHVSKQDIVSIRRKAGAMVNQALVSSDAVAINLYAGIIGATADSGSVTEAATGLATSLVEQLGKVDAGVVLKSLVAGMDSIEQVATGLNVALAGKAEALSALKGLATDFSPAGIEAFNKAVSADMLNGAVVKAAQQKAHGDRVAARKQVLIQSGMLTELTKAASDRLSSAKANLEQTTNDMEIKRGIFEEKQHAIEMAVDYYVNEHPDDALAKEMCDHGLAEVDAAAADLANYEQAVENAQQEASEAEAELKAKTDEAMAKIDAEAEAYVASEEAAELAESVKQAEVEQEVKARTEQEATELVTVEQQADAADEQRISEAVDGMGVDQDQGEEIKARINARLAQHKSGGVNTSDSVSRAEGIALMRKLGRKLGMQIEIGTPKAGRGQYGSGRIVLSDKLTVGQAIVEVGMHEITHGLEGTKSYDNYANIAMSMLFGDDQSQKTGIQAKIAEYAKQGVKLNEDGARRELVAEFTRTRLADPDVVERLADNGIAGKLRDIIHNVVQTFKGFTLRGADRIALDNLRRAERALDKAVKEMAAKAVHPTATQFNIPQLAQAAGMYFDEATTSMWTENPQFVDGVKTNENAHEVKEFTPEMLDNTPFGTLIKAGKNLGNFIDAKGNDVSDAVRKMITDITNLCINYKDSGLVWDISGSLLESTFSGLKANSDAQYGRTVDFGTICTKTQAIIDTMSRVMVENGRGLTRQEILDVYREVHDVGLDVPCPVCYVFSRWMGVPSMLDSMRRYQEKYSSYTQEQVDAYIDKMMGEYGTSKKLNSEKTKVQAQINKLAAQMFDPNTRTYSDEVAMQIDTLAGKLEEMEAFNWITQVLCKETKKGSGKYLLDKSYNAVPGDVLFDLAHTDRFANDRRYAKSWTYRTTRGAAMGKAIMPYGGTAIGDIALGYNGMRKLGKDNKLLAMNEKTSTTAMRKRMVVAKAQNLIGGQRLQSTSDFRAEWGLDYFMAFLEMQALGSKAQMYTKVLEAVDFFCSTGADVNMSAMGKGNGYSLDENGNPVLTDDDFSKSTGVDIKVARELVKKHSNAQIILVGMNDTHIKLAIASDDITFVIPWHSSGNTGDVLSYLVGSHGETLVDGTDYQNIQSDKIINKEDKAAEAVRNLRKDILTGALMKRSLTASEQDILSGNKYLQRLYDRFYEEGIDSDAYHNWLTATQAKSVFPHEYWNTPDSVVAFNKEAIMADPTLQEWLCRIEMADENSKNFKEYCASLGLKPRFSGLYKGGKYQYGNFSGYSDVEGQSTDAVRGYWKLLIDRRMYDVDGNYRSQQTIDVSKVDVGQMPQGKARNGYEELRAKYNDPAKLEKAVENSQRAIAKRQEENIDRIALAREQAALAYSEEMMNDDVQLNLNSTDMITDADIDQFLYDNGLLSDPRNQRTNSNGINTNTRKVKERQFSTETAQESNATPEWLKDMLYNDPDTRFYDVDSNRSQVERNWDEMFRGTTSINDSAMQYAEYLANKDGDFDVDDTAKANILMSMAFHGDVDQGIVWQLTARYAKEGTKAGQLLQARKLFQRMTPTGMQMWAVNHANASMVNLIENYPGRWRQVQDAADIVRRKAMSKGNGTAEWGAQIARKASDNQFGVDLNNWQVELLNQYDLWNEQDPGIHYNRATTKQRMLMAILHDTTPFSRRGLANTDLAEQLEIMKLGKDRVWTNYDSEWAGERIREHLVLAETEGPNSRPAAMAAIRAYEAYANANPVSMSAKYRTMRYMGMLLNVPSALRNLMGNGMQNVSNAEAHAVEVGLDKILSAFTGQRTSAMIDSSERMKGWQEFVRETIAAYNDNFVDMVDVSASKDRYDTRAQGRTFETNMLETARNIETFLMSSCDRNFWAKAYMNSMDEQRAVAELNGEVFDPTDPKVIEQARYDADYSTFSEDNAAVDAWKKLKQMKGIGPVLDFVVPFTGVPTNILKRGIEFSPVGVVSAITRAGMAAYKGQGFNQHQFVSELSKGLTGTGKMLIGLLLARMGLLRPGTEKDKDGKIAGIDSAQGIPYSWSINVFGQNVALSTLNPFSAPFIVGASLDSVDGLGDAIYQAATGSIALAIDASYMSNVQEVIKALAEDDPIAEVAKVVGASVVSQSVPFSSLVSEVASALDPYARDLKDKNFFMAQFKTLCNKIPGVRNMMPAKVDVTGNKVANAKNTTWMGWLANFVDPFSSTKQVNNPVLTELQNLYEANGSSAGLPSDRLSGSKNSITFTSGKAKTTITFTGAQKESYKTNYGTLLMKGTAGGTWFDKNGKLVSFTGLEQLMQSPKYISASPEERAKMVQKIEQAAAEAAWYEAGREQGLW